MDHESTFEFTYSAPEQEEIKKIRSKYLPPDETESKIERLRRLDASTTKKGTVISIVIGIISALIMGAGMSMCMVGPSDMLIPGIVIGVIGLIGVALAYPIYARITRKERERLTPEILKLTEELLQ